MTGAALKEARLRKGWTQQEAAQNLGVTQAYLSMVESGRRAVSSELGLLVVEKLELPPTALPLADLDSCAAMVPDAVRAELAALGYPGFVYLKKRHYRNPAEVLACALDQPDLDARVAEGLPWLVWRFYDLNWEWVFRHVRLHDRQNRLGFTITLAMRLAEQRREFERVVKLSEASAAMERSRLLREDTFCHDTLTEAEKNWLRVNRPAEAEHWNVLSDLRVEDLKHAVD